MSGTLAFAVVAAMIADADADAERRPLRTYEGYAQLTAESPIDSAVLSRLQDLGVQPARVCSSGTNLPTTGR